MSIKTNRVNARKNSIAAVKNPFNISSHYAQKHASCATNATQLINDRKTRTLITLLLSTIPSFLWAGAINHSKWPTVSNMDVQFEVSQDAPHIKLDILSTDGEPLYALECHKGDLDKSYKSSGDYAQFFQCKIIPYYEHEIDLFMPGGNWDGRYTRASFSVGWGDKCESHPYYGLKRNFRLRGMDIALDMSPIKFSPSIQEMMDLNIDSPSEYSFSFDIKINADSNIRNDRAMPAPEVCVPTYSLDENGVVVETIQLYPESE